MINIGLIPMAGTGRKDEIAHHLGWKVCQMKESNQENLRVVSSLGLDHRSHT